MAKLVDAQRQWPGAEEKITSRRRNVWRTHASSKPASSPLFLGEDMNDIIEQLKRYDEAYYNGEALISDEEYDVLRESTQELFPEHPYFKDVGAPVAGEKAKLPFILGSLEKKKPDTIEKWWKENSQPKVITPKLDGVSFYVEYRNGKVYKAATRGDGVVGRDITEKAKIFCPEMITKTKNIFRGEAMLMGDDYISLGFKTRRNGAAGLLNQDSNKNVDKIVPVFHEAIDGEFYFALNESVRFDLIRAEFPNNSVFCYDIDDFDVDRLFEIYNGYKDCGLDIDGLVITDLWYERENVMRPKRKIAFKMMGESYKTKVINVVWNVGRTGRITPVVEIELVDIEGVNVSRATGFNYEYIKNNKIGYGSEVEVCRSGDVIPYLVRILSESENPIIPKNCPSCNSGVIVKGVDIVCVNPDCLSIAYKKVENFLITLGTTNITEKTLTKLGLDTIQKCYEIDEFEISEFDGFGLKRGQQIVDEIQRTLITTPDKFIAAYGIPNVSKTTAKEVMEYFNNDFDAFCGSNIDELQEISNVGEKTAKNILENLDSIHELYNLLNERYGFTFRKDVSKMKGLKFTLTGEGPMKRSELQEMIESVGGEVKGISKSVNYLVAADTNSASGKAKKAREYGIPVISYDWLLEMLKGYVISDGTIS